MKSINTDTIEGYTTWLASLDRHDLQDEVDERSFDSEQNDTGQWGDYDARHQAARAEVNKRGG